MSDLRDVAQVVVGLALVVLLMAAVIGLAIRVVVWTSGG